MTRILLGVYCSNFACLSFVLHYLE